MLSPQSTAGELVGGIGLNSLHSKSKQEVKNVNNLIV